MYLVLSGSFEFTLFCLFWTYINLVQPPQECHAFELKLLLYFKYSDPQPQPSKKNLQFRAYFNYTLDASEDLRAAGVFDSKSGVQ